MAKVRLGADGQLVCPHCGASAFANQRKAGDMAWGGLGGATIAGPLGALAGMGVQRKRLKCLACGKYSDSNRSLRKGGVRSTEPPIRFDPADLKAAKAKAKDRQRREE